MTQPHPAATKRRRRAVQPAEGVHRHGTGWRARMMFDGVRHQQTFATVEEANAAIADWAALRDLGRHPETEAVRTTTLGSAAQRWLDRRLDEDLAEETRRSLTRATKPWRTGPLAKLPLRFLTYAAVREAHEQRARTGTRSSANQELRNLKAILRDARDAGVELDPRLLGVKPVKESTRPRGWLTVAELLFLADHIDPHYRRMLLLYGTTGMRCGELASMTSDRVNLTDGWLFVPAAMCKERRDKYVDTTPQEDRLMTEQLAATMAQTGAIGGNVFLTKTGVAVTHDTFLRYFHLGCAAAAAAWTKANPDAVGTPYDDLTPHDLRSTAAVLMRDAGMTREDAAARLGHADAGVLLSAIYDRRDKRDRARTSLRSNAPAGLLGATPVLSAGPSSQPPRLTDPTASVTTPDDVAAGSAGTL